MKTTETKIVNPLEVFLLVFIEFGLETPYDLLSKAQLGPGLTSPALKRLEEAGLLTSSPGPRSSLRYAITKKGSDSLKEGLKLRGRNFMAFGQKTIFDSLPRGIILAWLYSGVDEAQREIDRAEETLLVSSRKRQRAAEDLKESMTRLQASIEQGDPGNDKGALIGTAFQWIKAEFDAALYSVEAEAIGRLRQLLSELPPPPKAGDAIQSDPS